MKYKLLKKLNKKMSTIGLGTWSLSNENNSKFFYKKISKNNVIKILNKAFDKGINYYDTSPAYGISEKLIGKVFNSKRNDIILSTKIGLDKFGKRKDFSVSKVEKQLYKSLKDLKTDYLDILYFYNPEFNKYELEKSYEFIKKMQDKGVINSIGISFKSPSDIDLLNNNIEFEFAQCNFNILDHRLYKRSIVKYISKNNVHIIARTILGLGALTEENYVNNYQFNKNDIRKNWSTKQINLWKSGIHQIKKFTKNKSSIENIALKYCLSEKLITSCLLGVSNIKELENNLSSNNFVKLENKTIKFIKNLNNKKNFFLKNK